jgi:hypothetical protein
MNNVVKVKFPGRKRPTSVLGLSLDGSRLEGVVLQRANGSLESRHAFSVVLALDPLTAAPDLAGQEIRNQLDAAGIKERVCVVAVPLRLALTTTTELPALSDEDAASLLQLEAERGFPCDVDTLRLSDSRCALDGGKRHVLMAGVANGQLAVLEQVLAAAKLKPLSFSLGLAALQPPDQARSNGVLAFHIGESHVGLQITAGGGVAALRALEGAVETEGSRRGLRLDVVARETRITLGQLPAELRQSLKKIRVFGPADLARPLVDELRARFRAMDLEAEVVAGYAADEFDVRLPATATLSPAFSAAALALTGRRPAFEFLPPKPTALQLLVKRYSSGKLRTAGGLAAAVVAVVLVLFLVQQVQLSMLRSRWNGISAKVSELDGMQGKISGYRPWFDESFQSLGVLRELTLAFPEDGAVTAKTIEIREGGVVSCTGTAKDNASLLKTLNQLRAAETVNDLKVGQIRGKSPLQFTFEFRWGRGGRP